MGTGVGDRPARPREGRPVLAIDPGREKCGVAVVGPGGRVLYRAVVARRELVREVDLLAARFAPSAVVVGDRTGANAVEQELGGLDWVRRAGGVRRVDERGSSHLARQRYWAENPPRGLWRLVPTGMRVPPCPVDDLAAIILAERYLETEAPHFKDFPGGVAPHP